MLTASLPMARSILPWPALNSLRYLPKCHRYISFTSHSCVMEATGANIIHVFIYRNYDVFQSSSTPGPNAPLGMSFLPSLLPPYLLYSPYPHVSLPDQTNICRLISSYLASHTSRRSMRYFFSAQLFRRSRLLPMDLRRYARLQASPRTAFVWLRER